MPHYSDTEEQECDCEYDVYPQEFRAERKVQINMSFKVRGMIR